MADPLSEVYQGRDNTGSAAVFGNTPNQLGTYIKDQQAQELARIKAQPKSEAWDASIDADLGQLGKAHPSDIPALTEQYTKVLALKKQWLNEKDPMKKAQVIPMYIAEKAKLASGIANSNRTIAALQKSDEFIRNDKKHLAPEDFNKRKEDFLKTSVWERPEDFDYGVLSPYSAVEEGVNRIMKGITPEKNTVVTITTDGRKLTKTVSGVRESKLNKAAGYDWDYVMPLNQKNIHKTELLDALHGDPTKNVAPDPHAVEIVQKYGLTDEAAKQWYIENTKTVMYPKFQGGIFKDEPAPKSGASKDGDKTEFKGGSMNTVEVTNVDGTKEYKTTVIPKTAKDYTFQFEDGKGSVERGTFMYISRVDGGDPMIVASYTDPISRMTEVRKYPANATNLSQIDKLMQSTDSYYQHIGKGGKKKYIQKKVGASAPKSTPTTKSGFNYGTIK